MSSTSSLHFLGPKHGKVVVCYLAAWSAYRKNRGSFVIEDVDPTLCTHIVYSFAGLSLTHDGIISLGKVGFGNLIPLLSIKIPPRSLARLNRRLWKGWL